MAIAPKELMTVGHCGWKYRGVIVEFSTLPSRAWLWQDRRAGPATAAPTPALTAARAPRESWPAPSTPTSAAGGRNFHLDRKDFHRDQGPRPVTHLANSGYSGSSGISVTGCNDNLPGVTIIRRMATCWTCGRTYWVWRLRERNFCSGKCRVRHHRSRGYRNPSRSKWSNN